MENQKKRDWLPKKEVKKQLDDLQDHGQPLHYEQDTPLTPQDVRLIKRLFLKITLLCLAFSLPFAVAIYFFQDEGTVLVVCGVLLICLGYAVVKAAYQLASNLRAGKKTIVRGIITDRFTKKHFGPMDEDGKRDERTLNYLQIGSREFRVSQDIYANYKIGQAVELHYILASQGKPFFIQHRRLKGAGVGDSA